MDYKFDNLNKTFHNADVLNGDYSNAAGVAGVSGEFEWIGRQNLRNIPMTGLRSKNPAFHGLVIGDRIKVTVTGFIPGSIKWDRGGVYDVQEVHDVDDVSYDGELIVIHQNIFNSKVLAENETANGTWEKVDPTTPLTPYFCKSGTYLDPAGSGVCLLDVPTCAKGQHVDTATNLCVNDAGQNLPSWAIWVAVAAVAGIGIYFGIKHKGHKIKL